MDLLTANAIHDLKNSLHALNCWLGDAERSNPSPALHEARALAQHASLQLVQLLTLYRSSEDCLRLAIDDQYLPAFVEELRQEPVTRQQAELRIDYDVSHAETIGTWAFDAYQVKLVLTDALRNAARHARRQVSFALTRVPDGGIEFMICDDGPGYPTHILAGDEAVMGDNGSGLGLRFARLIASAHRTPDGRSGAVLLDNQAPDGGARLRLRLP